MGGGFVMASKVAARVVEFQCQICGRVFGRKTDERFPAPILCAREHTDAETAANDGETFCMGSAYPTT
jgi:hypothetical protein